MLNAQDLGKLYRKSRVVDQVSLRVDHGEVVGLFGRYGAGKTPPLGMLIGSIKATEGTIEFCGEMITALPVFKTLRKGWDLFPRRIPSSGALRLSRIFWLSTLSVPSDGCSPISI